MEHFHDLHSDDGFSRAAGKDNRSKASARPLVAHKRFCGGNLVVADFQILLRHRFFAERYLKLFAVVQGRLVLDGPAQLQKFLLYDSAVGQLKQKGQVVFGAGSGRQEFFCRGIVQYLRVNFLVARN